MATASSQESSTLIDQSIPQWKRELILRRRALARTLPAGNTSVKLTCPSVVTAVRQAEQAAAVENVSGKEQRCISSAIASNKGLLDQAQADFHPRGRISDSSSPSTTVTAAVVGNMRLVEHHADACTDLMINGVGLDTNTLSIDPNSLKYRAKMGEEKSIKKSCASSRTIMDNSVVMSENNNCSHPRDEDCQSDSSEELQYGPGIVNKLKSKYMSMTLRENQNRGVRPSLANMRRATSLENMLDSDDLETGKPQIKTQYRFTKRADAANNIGKIQHTSHHQQRYRGISRGNDSMKRARSVETLYRYDKCNTGVVPVVTTQLPVNKSVARDVNKNSTQVVKPVANDEIVIVESKKTVSEDRVAVPQQQKMRTSSIASEGELPPPDLVKQTLKIFEGSPVRKSARVPGKALSVATKTQGYKNTNLSKLNSNASQNINLSGSSSKPILSPKPSPEKIRRNTTSKPSSPRKVVPASSSPDLHCTSPTVPNRLFPLETSNTPPLSPTSSVSVGINKLKSPSPTTEIRKSPITLRDSSDSEPPSLSPIPHSSPVVNGRTDAIDLLVDDVPSSDEDTTDGITKPVSRSALENIRNDGMSMQFSFNTNGNTGTSSEKSKSYLPSVKSVVTSGQSRPISTKSPSPVFEKNDSSPSKPVSSLPGLKSPDSPQTQQKQMAVIRPIVTSKVSPSSTTPMSLTDREIEKNMINRERSIEPPMCKKKTIDQVSSELGKGRVEDSVKSVLPNSLRGGKESKGPGLWDNKPWHQQGQNTMKFDFTKCKDPIPPYIENDGLILAPKREKLKSGESVIILNNPGAITESSTDDVDEYSVGVSGPPSPCNVHFEGDNVLINGRSNIRKHPRQAKLRITFNDAATTTYEYPSEASFLNEVASPPVATSSSNGAAPTMPLPPSPSGSTPGVPFGGSSLASYTPSKVHLGGEDFQLGVTRSTPHTGRPVLGPEPIPEPEAVEEDYLKPAEDSETVAWSAETAADLLF